MAWANALWVSAILVVMTGCHLLSGPSSGPPPCVQALAGPCTGIACGGGNSPFTNIFPVNGVSANGACNADGIQLIPGSLESRQCGPGFDLTFETDSTTGTAKLIGTKPGHPPCKGPALENATFFVRSPWRRLQLTIDKVEQFPDEAHGQHEGYRITGNRHSTCDLAGARQVLQDLGFRVPAAEEPPESYIAGGYVHQASEDLVIAMPGPIFHPHTAEPIPGLDLGMFNLACAGDALAKTNFYGLGRNAQFAKAALRMFTANYCGTRLTVRGMQIEWEVSPTAKGERETEAWWDQDGRAICIEHPRLAELPVMSAGARVSLYELPQDLQACGCKTDPKQPGKCDHDKWIKHLQNECDLPMTTCAKIPNPPPIRFKSFVDPDGHVIIGDLAEPVP